MACAEGEDLLDAALECGGWTSAALERHRTSCAACAVDLVEFERERQLVESLLEDLAPPGGFVAEAFERLRQRARTREATSGGLRQLRLFVTVVALSAALGGGSARGSPHRPVVEGGGSASRAREAVDRDPSATPGGEAAAGLEAARQLEREAGKGPGATERLRVAAAAYERLASDFPRSPREASEALFRLGTIRATLREPERARTAWFDIVTTYPGEKRLGAKALLEVAHLVRRERDLEAALTGYDRVAAEPGADREDRAEAGLWAAKLLAKLDRPTDARAALEAFPEEFPDRPREALEAADLLIAAWIEAGDLRKAQEAYDAAVATFEERARRAESEAKEIRKGLESLDGARRIARAREKEKARRANP
jgi:tetratricopeptide (TPR) repeat protein